jgi:hypothetical protein
MKMKQYSRLVGWVFFGLGIVSVFTDQLFGYIQFDPLQNIFRLGIGVFAIAISRPHQDPLYAKSFCFITSPSFIVVCVISFIYPNWGNMHFEAVENILHLGLGLIGLHVIWNDWKQKRLLEESSSSSSSSSSSPKA